MGVTEIGRYPSRGKMSHNSVVFPTPSIDSEFSTQKLNFLRRIVSSTSRIVFSDPVNRGLSGKIYKVPVFFVLHISPFDIVWFLVCFLFVLQNKVKEAASVHPKFLFSATYSGGKIDADFVFFSLYIWLFIFQFQNNRQLKDIVV